jgi:hypothetical protein
MRWIGGNGRPTAPTRAPLACPRQTTSVTSVPVDTVKFALTWAYSLYRATAARELKTGLNATCAAAETVIRGPFSLLVAAATFMKDFAAFREMARAVEHPASYPHGYGEREVDAEGRLGRRSAQNLGRVPGELCGAHLAPDHGTTVTPFACSPKKPSQFSAADWCRQASRKATFVTSVVLSRPK